MSVPIFQTSLFVHDALGTTKGYSYSRTDNPTRRALEVCLASLEEATFGMAFASGMAAIDAVVRQHGPDDHIVLPAHGYGGTYKLLTRVHRLAFTTVDQTDLAAVEAAITPQTRLVWVESPTNPDLDVVDISAMAALAHDHGARCVVDNTFATPYLQRPLALGADVVVHSTTKYLGGHSDVIGGFVACDDPDLAAGIAMVQTAAGAVPGPMDCFLVLRGIKTLALRMERHGANAKAVADAVAAHPGVARVAYPGFGGMVAVTLAGGEAAARTLVERTRIFVLGESLGGVESLIGYPTEMSHAVVAGTELAIDPGLVRLSVGVEDSADLVADLLQALDSLG